MLEQTFVKWLGRDVMAAKYALLVALEKRDKLLYIEEPELKEEYMEKIGGYEEQVLELELEASLQEKKKQMIQAAINRREKVDLEKIDQMLEEIRAEKLKELNQNSQSGETKKEGLAAEQKEELQKLYKEIVNSFHPQVHSDMTETQKELYERALEAYKRQSLEELRLIYEMLFEESDLKLSLDISITKLSPEEAENENIEELTKSLMSDYSLAGELYPYFETLEKDAVLFESKMQYENRKDEVLKEIRDISNRFPFIAKDTLRDEEKLTAYLKALEARMNSAKLSCCKLKNEIAVMILERV